MKWYDFKKYRPERDSYCMVQMELDEVDVRGKKLNYYSVADFYVPWPGKAPKFYVFDSRLVLRKGKCIFAPVVKWAYLKEPNS